MKTAVDDSVETLIWASLGKKNNTLTDCKKSEKNTFKNKFLNEKLH
jgi:hypothetical protein